jgi:hypothetical protein
MKDGKTCTVARKRITIEKKSFFYTYNGEAFELVIEEKFWICTEWTSGFATMSWHLVGNKETMIWTFVVKSCPNI